MAGETEKTAAPSRQAEGEEEKVEKVKKIDFKMVTFTLAGKDYGINIMNVKEISKASSFTYVPNSSPFVRGVHNLRGEIISIIDLRTMFNLEFEEAEDAEMENILILRLEDHLIGVIVDSIDKVVGIDSDYIQPPHPLFGDINIKYISGVVEETEKLYIILDAERIFSEEEEDEIKAEAKEMIEKQMQSPVPARNKPQGKKGKAGKDSGNQEREKEAVPAPEKESGAKGSTSESKDEMEKRFIKESLVSQKAFYATPVNQEWIDTRYEEWKKERGKDKIQLQDAEDAAQFLSPFYSASTGRLWDKETQDRFRKILPENKTGGYTVWNPGCGKGYESYSLAQLIKTQSPDIRLKIFGNDSDLLAISNAPTLNFKEGEIPEGFKEKMVETKSGWQFDRNLKDLIMFEYHDVTHTNPYANLDLVVARDIVSFLKPESQIKFFRDVQDKMKKGGIIVLGDHEKVLEQDGWKPVESEGISAFQKV